METNFHLAAQSLVDIGRAFDTRGWVPASSGNFSARVSADRIAITASGRHKGALSVQDILTIDRHGKVLEGDNKPSYETGLHTQLYSHNERLACVLHTHSVFSTVLSRQAGDVVTLQGYELLKIFEGINSHEVSIEIPVYKNDQDIEALASRIDADMKRSGMGHAYMIEGHGIYTWGPDIMTTRYRVEALEFMLECEYYSQCRSR